MKALDALLQSWKERLSLITVIVRPPCLISADPFIFLVHRVHSLPPWKHNSSAGLLPVTHEMRLQYKVLPTQGSQVHWSSIYSQASGFLKTKVHTVLQPSALISFFAAFFLIQYELCEVVVQGHQVEHGTILTPNTTTVAAKPGVFTADPHLEHRGPFGIPTPPINLLRKCNLLCMWLTAIGSILALMGVICSTWSTMPESVSIFTSACAGFCVVPAIFAFC